LAEGLVIDKVAPASIAAEMELRPGDRVLAVDGQEVVDIVDFQYLTAEEKFRLLVAKADGEVWELDIEREPGEILGLEVEEVGPGGLKRCCNNCVFCFVAQMPKGMRSTLYDRDDDYRLSLTQGSFITLSNLTEEELERILNLRLSPLYVSVHAWDPETRVRLMRNPQAGKLPAQLARLAAAGITMHLQVVLVPGYNDGEILRETVARAGALFPAVQSIAIVPVGLTRFRENLPALRGFTSAEARALLSEGETWQASFRQNTGRGLVYFADEFYVLAGRAFPPLTSYDDLPQLENGVGMASKFEAELDEVWERLPFHLARAPVHLITGTSAGEFFRSWAKRLQERIAGLELIIHVIENRFFGPSVTVAGLVTAQDIVAQVGNLDGADFLVPQVMLKADTDVFLDDHDLTWLEQKLDGRAIVVPNDGAAFAAALTGMEVLELE